MAGSHSINASGSGSSVGNGRGSGDSIEAHAFAGSSVPSGSFTFNYPAGPSSSTAMSTPGDPTVEGGTRRGGAVQGQNQSGKEKEQEKEKDAADADDAKRRKISRACDACRRKKIKCSLMREDQVHASSSKCAHCIEYGLPCTFVEEAKRRGPPKGYLETLEQRCGRLERMMQQLHPGLNLAEYIGPPIDRDEFDVTTHTEALRAANIPPYPRIKPITVPLQPVASNASTDSYTSPVSHLGSGTPTALAQAAGAAAGGSRQGSISAVSGLASGLPPPNTQILGPSPWKLYEQDPNRPSTDHEEEADAETHREITQAMNKLNMKDDAWRYHGKASLAHLLSTFQELKHISQEEDGEGASEGVREATGPKNGHGYAHSNAQSPAVDSPASATSTGSKWTRDRAGQEWVTFFENMNQTKRPEFWAVPEYEVVIANENVRPVDFAYWPDSGLDHALIDAYFDKVNVDMPLLNRLIFVRQYTSGLHRTNHDFAKVCLMVFANGARFTHDERIYWPRDWATTDEGRKRLEEDADGTWKYSAGWKYMRAVLKMGRSVVTGPNLFDFQSQVLVCMFLQGAAVPHLTLLISGMGLRGVQELGIHVRSTLMRANPVERALYNRAFWCLYHIDRLNCAAVGRSIAIQDTDFDADYPIAVDDEYWETGDPSTDFVQPAHAGVSKVSAFVHLLKLDHVIGAALRTLYAINRLPGDEGQDMAHQRAIVMELDSALNSWADSVPDSLRWDPTRTDQRLFEQSAVLYSQYYYCQILIHRPFIPTPRRPVTIGLPSLVICSNASRSIANIVDAVLRRGRQYGILAGQVVSIHYLIPVWTAAVILLVSIYAGRQQKAERERAMQDVRRCIAALKEMEMTWRQAGKMTDMLCQLASEPIKRPLVEYGSKRRQPDEEVGSPKRSSVSSWAALHAESPAGQRGKGKRGLAGRASLSKLRSDATGGSPATRSASHGSADAERPSLPFVQAFRNGSGEGGMSSTPTSRPKTPPLVWGLDSSRRGNTVFSRDDLDLDLDPAAGPANANARFSDLEQQARALAEKARADGQACSSIIHNYVQGMKNRPDTVPFHSPSTFATDLMAPSASDPTVRAVPSPPRAMAPSTQARGGTAPPMTPARSQNMTPFQLNVPDAGGPASRRGSSTQPSPTALCGVASFSAQQGYPTGGLSAPGYSGPGQPSTSAPAPPQAQSTPAPGQWFDPSLLQTQPGPDTSWIADTFAQPISAYPMDAPTSGSGAELAIPFDMENLWDNTLFNPGGYDFGDVSMGGAGNAGAMGMGMGMGMMDTHAGMGTGMGMGMGDGPGFMGMGSGDDMGMGSGMGIWNNGMAPPAATMPMVNQATMLGNMMATSAMSSHLSQPPQQPQPQSQSGGQGQEQSQRQGLDTGSSGMGQTTGHADSQDEDLWKRYFHSQS